MSTEALTQHARAFGKAVDKVGRTKESIVELGAELRERGETEGPRGAALADQLEAALKTCIRTEQTARGTEALLKRLRQDPREPDPRGRLQEALSATAQSPFEYDEAFQRFQKRARGQDPAGEDDDLYVEERDLTEVPRCPFSGMEIQDPVKSSECGHSYDKAGIEQAFGQHPKTCRNPKCVCRTSGNRRCIPCPHHGCHKPVYQDALPTDYKLEFAIRKLRETPAVGPEETGLYTQID